MEKNKQKQLITEIMNEDAKDGLYKKQTAVEWFANELAKKGLLVIRDYKNLIAYRQAKEMEKQQMVFAQMDMFNHINKDEFGLDYLNKRDAAEEFAEQYYNEEYGK